MKNLCLIITLFSGWFVGLFCALAQMATLFLFIEAADIANANSDLEYSLTCSMNSLECEDENSLDLYGGLIFGLILSVWLMKDIIASLKLLMIAMWKKNIDYFFGSMIILLVTALSAWTSVYCKSSMYQNYHFNPFIIT